MCARTRSGVSDSVTPWTVACLSPPSMGFLKQEYWSELPSPSPGALPDSGMGPVPPALQADSLPLSHQELLDLSTFFFMQKYFLDLNLTGD